MELEKGQRFHKQGNEILWSSWEPHPLVLNDDRLIYGCYIKEGLLLRECTCTYPSPFVCGSDISLTVILVRMGTT